MYNEQCTLLQSTLYIKHCTMNTVHWPSCTVGIIQQVLIALKITTLRTKGKINWNKFFGYQSDPVYRTCYDYVTITAPNTGRFNLHSSLKFSQMALEVNMDTLRNAEFRSP
jgi:hypothetical protein